MNIITQTQLQKNTISIQNATNKALRSIVAAKEDLNSAYNELWNLPEERLRDVLQYLLQEGKLEEVFTNHHIAATSLNAILTSAGYSGSLAIATAAREFEVTDGVISLVEVEVVYTPSVIEEVVAEEPLLEE
jgi:hypothetical protein